jgi:ABC-type transport system, involved in lipoprotein release, permease component
MENYTDISKKYVMQNRKRSILTIIGCALVAAVLFAFLNSFNNFILKERIDIRSSVSSNWEILVYNDDKDIAEAIINEDFVRSASMGSAHENSVYMLDDGASSNSIFLNVKNIYKVRKIGKYLQDTYQVDIEYNEYLLSMYLIDFTGDMWLAVLFGIFISYIFAIIGIGIIRNSISISAIERLKDYGELRCIGATKGQIRSIVFRESLIQEGIGVSSGILLGYIVSIFFCLRYSLPLKFHIVPALMVAVCFLFDLFFVVNESTKKIIRVQPVDAVRGNYRIKTGRLRRLRSGLWGLIFGVEGDYAYKNVKRNKLRFFKTIAAISFGIATVVVVGGTVRYMMGYVENVEDAYGYYQDFLEGSSKPFYDKDMVKSTLYSPDQIRAIKNSKGVDEISYLYMTNMYTENIEEISDRLRDGYLYSSEEGIMSSTYEQIIVDILDEPDSEIIPYEQLSDESKEAFGDEEKYLEFIQKRRSAYAEFKELWADSYGKGEGLLDYDSFLFPEGKSNTASYYPGIILDRSAVKLYGYSDRDWERYRDHLIEGTIDISDNGIVLVNGGFRYNEDVYLRDTDSMFIAPEEIIYTDYKVGDEITFVDPKELRMLVKEELKRAEEYDKIHLEEDYKWHKEHDGEWEENHKEEYKEHMDYQSLSHQGAGRNWIVEAAREKLISEGKCKTYVIEGIVDRDVNHFNQGPVFVMPLKNYLAATDNTEEDYNGFQIHFKNPLMSDITSTDYLIAKSINLIELENMSQDDVMMETELFPRGSGFASAVMMPVMVIKPLLYGGLIILIIVIVNCINIINVTLGNVALRRNEFAQLRALGMTKYSLFKAVILEGVIMWIISCVIGLVLGAAIQYMIYKYILAYVVNQAFTLNWILIISAMLISFAFLCGSYYFPMKRMRLDVAEELMKSGE